MVAGVDVVVLGRDHVVVRRPGAQPATRWGTEEVVAGLLGDGVTGVTAQTAVGTQRFADAAAFADLFHLLEQAHDVPPLHVSCGTEDPLLASNERFVAAADAHGVAVTTDLRPGRHEWGLWDAVVRDVVAWLPLRT